MNEAMRLALELVADGTLRIDWDAGRVWRDKSNGKPCEPRPAERVDDKGYWRITLGVPGKKKTCHVQAHCLIWIVANGPIPDGLQVNHKDTDKQNNRLGNLELTTGAGNMQHSYANGRPRPWSKPPEESLRSGTGSGTWRGKARVSEATKGRVRELRSQGRLYREIAKETGLSITHVQRITGSKK